MDFSACTDFEDACIKPLAVKGSPRVNRKNIIFPYLQNDLLNKRSYWNRPEPCFGGRGFVSSSPVEWNAGQEKYACTVNLDGAGDVGCNGKVEKSDGVRKEFDYSATTRLKVGYHHRCQTATDFEEVRLYQHYLNQTLIRNYRVLRKELIPQTKAFGSCKCESPMVGLKIKGIMKNFTTRRKVKSLTE